MDKSLIYTTNNYTGDNIMIKSVLSLSILTLLLSQSAYCTKDKRLTEDNTLRGPSIKRSDVKEPKPIGMVDRDYLQYDERRDSYYRGNNLSQFPAIKIQEVK